MGVYFGDIALLDIFPNTELALHVPSLVLWALCLNVGGLTIHQHFTQKTISFW